MFARPEYVWLLGAVPLAGLGLFLEGRRRRELAGGLPPWRSGQGFHAALLLLGSFFLALAAAGPRLGLTKPVGPAAPGRLVVALDCSKSMLARDLAPSRLDAAKALVRDVLARMPDLPAGLVIFAGRARLACPVTPDRDGLLAFLDAAGPTGVPRGGTTLATALEASGLALAGGGPGAVLLLTDGEDTLAAPDAGKIQGPPVVTVAVGGALPAALPEPGGGETKDATGAPVRVGVDAAGLAELAGRHGGKAFRLSPDAPAPGPAIATALAALVPTGPGRPGPPQPADRTVACLVLGLLALIADLLVLPPRLGMAGLALGLCLCPVRPALAASSAATMVDRGLHFFKDGRFEAARDAFLAARARNPDAAVILYDLGTAYYRLGRFDLAQGAFDRAATMTDQRRLRAAARYNQGNAAFRRGDLETAARCYAAALAEDPTDAAARANLALTRQRRQTPPPGQAALPDDRPQAAQTDTKKPSPTEQSTGNGQATRDGQAPPPVGQDRGQGPSGPMPPPERIQAGPAATAPNAPEAPAVPLAGANGFAAGPRLATPDAATLDTQLRRIPDLPGLPLPATGATRPAVEKDW